MRIHILHIGKDRPGLGMNELSRHIINILRSLDLMRKILGGEIARLDKTMAKITSNNMDYCTKKRRRMAQ
eukprot:9369092-Heterocapsa_arctica.AAC.1